MARKNKKRNLYIIIGLIALFAVGFYIYNTQSQPNSINGWYDAATKQCWVNKDTPPGTSFDPNGAQTTFSCCFNQIGEQIDCGDSNVKIGPKIMAVYGTMGGAGIPGKFFVQHGVIVTNTGNFQLDKIYILSANWVAGLNGTSTGVTALNTAWGTMVNRPSSAVAPGLATSFSSSTIDLQAIGTPAPLTANYNVSFLVKSEAYGGLLNRTSAPITGRISSQREDIGFNVVINWG